MNSVEPKKEVPRNTPDETTIFLFCKMNASAPEGRPGGGSGTHR
jgi:hypothetical protein